MKNKKWEVKSAFTPPTSSGITNSRAKYHVVRTLSRKAIVLVRLLVTAGC